MKAVQKLWVNRIHNLFYLFLGLLAGMSLMHLFVVMNQSKDKTQFLQLYASVCVAINIIFMVLTSFALILGLALTLIYKQKSEDKLRNMDPFSAEFRLHYIISGCVTLAIAVCQVLLYIVPFHTNKLYFWSPDNISDLDISRTKGYFGAVNAIFILAWLIASCFNKASISDMDMDPEDAD